MVWIIMMCTGEAKDDLENIVRAMMTDMSAIKYKLDMTQADLAATNDELAATKVELASTIYDLSIKQQTNSVQESIKSKT